MNKRIFVCMKWIKAGGGAEYITLEIIKVFLKLGWHVELYIKDKSENERDVSSLNINIKYCSYFDMLKDIKNKSPNIVFASDHKIATIFSIYKLIFGFRSKIIFRSITNLNEILHGKYFKIFLAKIFLRRVDVVISQSEGMKRELINDFNIDSSRLLVLSNPIKEPVYKKEKTSKIDYDYFLFVGRLAKEKGLLEFLLPAFKLYSMKNTSTNLIIIGDGPLFESINKYISENELENRVYLLGHKEDISYFYKNANALILTSLYEGFPNVIVEAMSYGKPVISFDTPHGPRDIIIDNVNGYLVDYCDLKKLEKTMIDFSCDKFDEDEIIKSIDKLKYENWVLKISNLIENI